MVKNAGFGDNFRMKLESIHGLIRFYGLYNIFVLFYVKKRLGKKTFIRKWAFLDIFLRLQ